ncbi:MAG TPA: hypothetical protein VHU23_16530 [Rhizomicrobium sp.]|jgi:hypothetical protein|nr:hypothetical protein [Rhizomicrobium sp.]
MSRVPFILIDGKRHLWRDILELRRAQLAECRKERQPPLFPLVEDVRPVSQRTAAGRYSEPLLFGE